MNYTLIDIAGLCLAVLSYGLALVLPGAALAALLGAPGFRGGEPATKPLVAIATGLAVLPALDSMATRFAGLDAALGLTLVLASAALVLAWREKGFWRDKSRPALAAPLLGLLAAWFVILAVEWVDFDIHGGLYQSFIAIDLVKHAATTQTILASGAPPRDPFFLRPEAVSYYYFFYTLTALSQRLCGGLIDARAAVGGLVFWTGLGVYGLARLLVERTGLLALAAGQDAGARDQAAGQLPIMARRLPVILLVLLAAGGLDIVFVLRMGLVQNYWLPDPTWWNDEVAGWLESLIWVPHHVTAMIAGLMGFMALAESLERRGAAAAAGIAMAGLCFASALGLSVWLAMVAAATAVLWFGTLAFERRWRAAGMLVLAGVVALLIAAPAIADLRAGRAAGGVPIEFAIRSFSPVDALVKAEPFRSMARAIALPLNYFAEFGVLFLGSLLFWRTNRRAGVHRNEMARVLTLGAIAGLVLGTLLRSTLFANNDLGWRVLMVPQMAALVWTSTALLQRWTALPAAQPMRLWRLVPPLPLTLLLLGYGTTLYAMVSLRTHAAMPLHEESRLFVTQPAADRARRAAYEWANDHLAPTLVLQHNPTFGKRVVNFGLYSRHRVGVGDLYGSLYGAAPLAVDRRLEAIIPIFTQGLSEPAIRARAQAAGIDELVVGADDPVWAIQDSWVWRARPDYASALVRLIPVAALSRTDERQALR